jgi:hypothetical protein
MIERLRRYVERLGWSTVALVTLDAMLYRAMYYLYWRIVI